MLIIVWKEHSVVSSSISRSVVTKLVAMIHKRVAAVISGS